MSFVFWQRWLFVACLLNVLFGVAMVFSALAPYSYAVNGELNSAFWQSAELSGKIQRCQRWIYGALGASIAAWTLMSAVIARYPFADKQRWARNAIAYLG